MTGLRAELLALVERWDVVLGDLTPEARSAALITKRLSLMDLRDLLDKYPEPAPADPSACPDCGRPDHPEHWCGEGRPPQHPAPAEPPAGAVRVRIAVAVDAEGGWDAAGGHEFSDDYIASVVRGEVGEPVRLSWIEAWVPRPEAETTIEGEVSDG